MMPETQPEPGRKSALLMTIIVHLGLALALFLGVQWKTEHAAVEVELWSPTPRPASIPPPMPPERKKTPPEPKPEPKPEPQPKAVKQPDIVVKKEEKPPVKPPEKKVPREVPRKAPKEPDFSDLLEQETQERQMAQANEREARLQVQLNEMQRAAGLSAWGNRIGAKIRSHIVLPPNIEGNPEAVFKVHLLPTGEVVGTPRLERSSGNPALDAAIERAILKASPLPKPDDSTVFVRELEIKYQPYETAP
jgi:colicin import membrane protein